MTGTITTKWADPKPGHEAEYLRATIDRFDASHDMLAVGWLGRIFFMRRYREAEARWADAMDRIKVHGQDRVRSY